MQIAYEYAIEEEKEIVPLIISNWKQSLNEIFNNEVPDKYLENLRDIENDLGKEIEIIDYNFPPLYKWTTEWFNDGIIHIKPKKTENDS